MSEQSFHLHIREFTDLFYDIRTLCCIRKSDSGHSCVHFNMEIYFFLLADCFFGKLARHRQFEDRRPNIITHYVFIRIREYKSQNQDGFFDSCLS